MLWFCRFPPTGRHGTKLTGKWLWHGGYRARGRKRVEPNRVPSRRTKRVELMQTERSKSLVRISHQRHGTSLGLRLHTALSAHANAASTRSLAESDVKPHPRAIRARVGGRTGLAHGTRLLALVFALCSAILGGCFESIVPPADRTEGRRGHQERMASDTRDDPPIAGNRGSEPASTKPTNHVITVRSDPGVVLVGQSIAGDLDGDGTDDLVLLALELRDGQFEDIDNLKTTAHVFYGRAELPTTLQLGDADARVRGQGLGFLWGTLGAHALGDLNGDGLADLLLAAPDEACFIFGNEVRLSGEVEVEDVAVRWSFDVDPLGPRLASVIAAGDVQGDGLSDVILVFEPTQPLGAPPTGASVPMSFLFAGQRTPWPSRFDQTSATAVFSGPDAGKGIRAVDAGDLDGDGRADLLFNDGGVSRIFPGSRFDAVGTINVSGAEALSAGQLDVRVVDDLNGDGIDELGWRSTGNTISLQYGTSVAPPAERHAPDLVIAAGGISLRHLMTIDFDGDGADELALPTPSAPNFPGGLYLVTQEQLRKSTRIDVNQHRPLLQWHETHFSDEGRPLDADLLISVGTGGDVTGDGVDDVAAVIVSNTGGQPLESYATIIPGSYSP